jgi:hypothetical protein
MKRIQPVLARLLQCGALSVVFLSLPAEDLVGIATPGRLVTPEWQLDLADSDVGPTGSATHDDWRVAHADVEWDHHWISAAVDYSILTFKNLSGTVMSTDSSGDAMHFPEGAGRSDEITASVSFRKFYIRPRWQSWAQIGPGIQGSGDFGGKVLQNKFHSVIQNSSDDLTYEHPRFQSVGLVQAGIGGRAALFGPFAADARSLALETTSGWTRWQIQGTLMANRGDTGIWAGMRQDDFAGHAQTSTADAVARHERGLSLIVGLSIKVGRCALGFESSHDFSNNGQDGYVSVALLH